MYFPAKLCRFFGWKLQDVLDMPFLKYKELITIIDVLEAEERFILQRQLDNHIKVQHKQTVDSFGDLYKEFQDVINGNVEIVRKKSNVTEEEAKANFRSFLAKLGGGAKKNGG